MLSDKPIVRNLVEISAAKGIEYVILSPGSRDAPLIISFNESTYFKCLSIPDERVAGYFALGIAQQTRKPVIITCTSGTAALNFAPAIAEAFYQKIPLLIVTADRPEEWIHQGEGQSINQRNVFANYVKKSYHLPEDGKDADNRWSANRMISEAIDQTFVNGGGPVHINIPFREPLYGQAGYTAQALPKMASTSIIEKKLPTDSLFELQKNWSSAKKKMILCGLLPKQETLRQLLNEIAQDTTVIVLAETTSNLIGPSFIHQIDPILTTIQEEEIDNFQPELLITIGGNFISKKIKQFLRKNKPAQHWHIEETDYHIDTFQSLTKSIPIEAATFFKQFSPNINDGKSANIAVDKVSDTSEGVRHFSAPFSSNTDQTATNRDYQDLWKHRKEIINTYHQQFLKKTIWSDLKAMEKIMAAIPSNSNLQLGNSTPVRYAQLFPVDASWQINANRGVAGIDGSTSTAAGAALANERLTTIITGDIAFFYDSNAFWHHHLTPNLRVILINNGGGNIFRYIPGPPTTNQLDTYFEAQHQLNAQHIAKTFNLNYYFVAEEKKLIRVLSKFFQKQAIDRPALLEIKTPNAESATILREYFKKLKNIEYV